MSKAMANQTFSLSLVVLLSELVIAFGLFFQPSWAIGWPFGVQPDVAMKVGTVGMLFIVVLTGFVFVLSYYGTTRSEEWFHDHPKVKRKVAALLLVALAVDGVVSALVFKLLPLNL